MLKAKGKIWKGGGGKAGHLVYISNKIVTDSQYPFKARERVKVELVPKENKIIITKMEASNES